MLGIFLTISFPFHIFIENIYNMITDLTAMEWDILDSAHNLVKYFRERALTELNFNREDGATEEDKQKRIERAQMYNHAYNKIEQEMDRRTKIIAG